MAKSVGQAEVDRLNWRGLKPLARDLLMVPAVNWLARSVLPERMAARVPVIAPSADFIGDRGVRATLLEPRNCQVAAELYRHEGRFQHPADNVVMAYTQALASQVSVFLDIGAYTGLFALLAARANPDLSAIAYEIFPPTFRLLTRNIEVNGLKGRVEARLVGLSDKRGELILPDTLDTTSLPSSLSITSTFASGVAIPLDTLDNQTAGLPGPVGMKIDVEGHEPAVLGGGRAFLERVGPDIIAEVLPGEGPEVQAILEPLGYSFWHFTADGLVQHNHLVGIRAERDWLLTRRVDPNSLLSRDS